MSHLTAQCGCPKLAHLRISIWKWDAVYWGSLLDGRQNNSNENCYLPKMTSPGRVTPLEGLVPSASGHTSIRASKNIEYLGMWRTIAHRNLFIINFWWQQCFASLLFRSLSTRLRMHSVLQQDSFCFHHQVLVSSFLLQMFVPCLSLLAAGEPRSIRACCCSQNPHHMC